MEKLARTITKETEFVSTPECNMSNERIDQKEKELAFKSRDYLDQLATNCFDNLTSKNKFMGTAAENLWTGTVNCQTYAKELVKELKCEWPEEVNVFVEKYLIGNVIIHVKREIEYTCST